jgi:hypothetical protein
MRRSLQSATQADYFCYGLSLDDLDYTERLVNDFIDARKKDIARLNRAAKKKYPDPDIHIEIISDNNHYAYVDEQYLWHFCIWRFQGILEGIILADILDSPKKPLFGLKAKLEEIKKHGYLLREKDIEECLKWGRLRNAFSHSPPEQFRPIEIIPSDIKTYKVLIRRIVSTLQKQKENKAESGRGDRIAPVTPPTSPGMRVRTGRFQSDH